MGATFMSAKDFRKIPVAERPFTLPHFQRLVSALGRKAAYIKQINPTSIIEHGQLWTRLQRHGIPTKIMLSVSMKLGTELVQEQSGRILTGHCGSLKAKKSLPSSYFWPNMDANISKHINFCVKCQASKKTGTMPHSLTPLPQCTANIMRVHIHLFGPLKHLALEINPYCNHRCIFQTFITSSN
jgi:hypothetical protein